VKSNTASGLETPPLKQTASQKTPFAAGTQAFPEREGTALAWTIQRLSLFCLHLVLLAPDVAPKRKHASQGDKFGVTLPRALGWGSETGRLKRVMAKFSLFLADPQPLRKGCSRGNLSSEPGLAASLQCPHWKYSGRQLLALTRPRQRDLMPPLPKLPPTEQPGVHGTWTVTLYHNKTHAPQKRMIK
jgi:hypothetical protein